MASLEREATKEEEEGGAGNEDARSSIRPAELAEEAKDNLKLLRALKGALPTYAVALDTISKILTRHTEAEVAAAMSRLEAEKQAAKRDVCERAAAPFLAETEELNRRSSEALARLSQVQKWRDDRIRETKERIALLRKAMEDRKEEHGEVNNQYQLTMTQVTSLYEAQAQMTIDTAKAEEMKQNDEMEKLMAENKKLADEKQSLLLKLREEFRSFKEKAEEIQEARDALIAKGRKVHSKLQTVEQRLEAKEQQVAVVEERAGTVFEENRKLFEEVRHWKEIFEAKEAAALRSHTPRPVNIPAEELPSSEEKKSTAQNLENLLKKTAGYVAGVKKLQEEAFRQAKILLPITLPECFRIAERFLNQQQQPEGGPRTPTVSPLLPSPGTGADVPSFLATPFPIPLEKWSLPHTERTCISVLKLLAQNFQSVGGWSHSNALWARALATHFSANPTTGAHLLFYHCKMFLEFSPFCHILLLMFNSRMPLNFFELVVLVMGKISAALQAVAENGIVPLRTTMVVLTREVVAGAIPFGHLELHQLRYSLLMDAANSNSNVKPSLLWEITEKGNSGMLLRTVTYLLQKQQTTLYDVVETILFQAAIHSPATHQMLVSESIVRSRCEKVRIDSDCLVGHAGRYSIAPRVFAIQAKGYFDQLFSDIPRHDGLEHSFGRSGAKPPQRRGKEKTTTEAMLSKKDLVSLQFVLPRIRICPIRYVLKE